MGQVRVDVEGNIGTINYSIDGAYRSQGHGKKMLSLVEAAVKEDFPQIKTLYAKVKETNIASLKIFEQLQYEKAIQEEIIRFAKEIMND